MSYPTPNTQLDPVDWLQNYNFDGNNIVIGQLGDFPELKASEADGQTGKIQSVLYALLDTIYGNLLNNVNGQETSKDVFYLTKSENSSDLVEILTTFDVSIKMKAKTNLVEETFVQKVNTKALPPSAPSGLVASNYFNTGYIYTDWTASASGDALEYHIYRTSEDVAPSVTDTPYGIVSSTETSFYDLTRFNLILGKVYYYWVVAWNKEGYSDFSTSSSLIYSGGNTITTYTRIGYDDGDLGNANNYNPIGIPNRFDSVTISYSVINPPSSGTLIADVVNNSIPL